MSYILDPVFDSLKSFKVTEEDLKDSPILEKFIPWNVGIPHSKETCTLISNMRKDHGTFKDSSGNIHYCHLSDPRISTGDLVGIASNKIAVKDSLGNNYLVDKDDPRYISGELVGVVKGLKWKQKNPGKLKGTILVKDRSGKMYRVKLDDPRYISGELIHFRKSF